MHFVVRFDVGRRGAYPVGKAAAIHSRYTEAIHQSPIIDNTAELLSAPIDCSGRSGYLTARVPPGPRNFVGRACFLLNPACVEREFDQPHAR